MKNKNILIVGSGEAGALIINEIRKNPQLDYQVLAAIDDNPELFGKKVEGISIIGDRNKIKTACKELDIHEIFITMPSVSPMIIQEIVLCCEGTEAKVKILPGLVEIIKDLVTVNVKQISQLSPEDLIGRPSNILDNQPVHKLIQGKSVLVTGAGGSIGSIICNQLTQFQPKKIIALDISENYLFDLLRKNPLAPIEAVLADIRQKTDIIRIFKQYSPQIIFHAAAYKHVPMMQNRPAECIVNNVIGSRNILEEGLKIPGAQMVFISTDKANQPISIMGASKRIMEVLVSHNARKAKRLLCSVRFGNVLGSHGSVIPIFQEQIAQGGPITVTSMDMERFFMSIDEAVGLILQAGSRCKGGEIFTLDMGNSINIHKLARAMIIASGYMPDRDIKIKITGIRPGEKIKETLNLENAEIVPNTNKKIYQEMPDHQVENEILDKLDELCEYADKMDSIKAHEILSGLFPTILQEDNR